jgi:hypothetical protein
MRFQRFYLQLLSIKHALNLKLKTFLQMFDISKELKNYVIFRHNLALNNKEINTQTEASLVQQYVYVFFQLYMLQFVFVILTKKPHYFCNANFS